MWNEPTEEQLERLPQLYATENADALDKIIHMHFFLGPSDWYAAEYGPEDRLFFGYAILIGDLDCSEWGYFSLDELRSVRAGPGIEIDRDLHWSPKPARGIESILAAHNRKGY